MKGTILVASTALSGRKLLLLTQREDINIVFCDTSREALEYLIENTPEFVVLDQKLESVAGIDIIRKIRKVKRLHNVPLALIDAEKELELTPLDKKLIDLIIHETLTEQGLLDKIQAYEKGVSELQKTHSDLKSTMFLEQAITQLNSDEEPDPTQSLTEAQAMMLSPSQKLQYLEAEVQRLNAMLGEYQERFGDIYADNHEEKKPWLGVLLKPVF